MSPWACDTEAEAPPSLSPATVLSLHAFLSSSLRSTSPEPAPQVQAAAPGPCWAVHSSQTRVPVSPQLRSGSDGSSGGMEGASPRCPGGRGPVKGPSRAAPASCPGPGYLEEEA